MFLDYFHLREQPFGVTPDPRFLVDTPSHREAWATLRYGLESGRGFLGLVAPPGLGKTTLLFRLMEELRGQTRTAFLFQTQCDSTEFLSLLLADFTEPPTLSGSSNGGLSFSEDSHWQEQCENICKATNAEGAAILLHQGPALACIASSGIAPPVGSMAATDTGFSGECFRNAQVIACDNAQTDLRIAEEIRRTLPYHSFLIAPLRSNGTVVGVVELLSSRASAFGPSEQQSLAAFCTGAAVFKSGNPAQRRRTSKNRAEMLDELQDILAQEAEEGPPAVLIVDEAQNLSDTVLETIRLLSDFETPRSKLLQVVLAGQTELEHRLASPSLVQLRQRISMMSALTPLTRAEVQDYISHRLRVAGYRGRPLFTPSACDTVATLSAGIPRNVNNVCFHSLSLAFALGLPVVDDDVLREVRNDLNWGNKTPAKEHPMDRPSSAIKEESPPAPVQLPRPHSTVQALSDSVLTELAVAVQPHSNPPLKRKSLPRAKQLVLVTVVAISAGLLVSFTLMRRGMPLKNEAKPVIIQDTREHVALPQASAPIGDEISSAKRTTSKKQWASFGVTQIDGARHTQVTPPSSSADTPEKAREQSPSADASDTEHSPAPNSVPPTSPGSTVEADAIPPSNVPTALDSPVAYNSSVSMPLLEASASERSSTLTPPSASSSSPTKSTFTDGALLKMVRPIYPSMAKQSGIQGDVVLNATISRSGDVKDVHTVSGDPALVDAAVDAVKQWHYEASRINGQPIDVQKRIVVKFTLSGLK